MPEEPDDSGPGALRRRGLEKMSEVYGWEFSDGPGDHFAVTADHLFATIWSRPGLSLRDRRLLLLGSLTAQGLFDVANIQISAALSNGELTEDELREISLFLCHYLGWPAGTKLDGEIGAVIGARRKAERQAEKARAAAESAENGVAAGSTPAPKD